MNIDEKIQEIQEKLVEILTNSYNREETVIALEHIGLDKDIATKFLEAFEQMKKDKEVVGNAWNTAELGDFLNDIENNQKNESESTQNFEDLHDKIALIVLAQKIQPEEINEELLDKLREENIAENEITNSSLKIAYHYYNENKATEEKMLQIANENIKLKTFYKNLQRILGNRIAADEKHYQDALAKIELLNNKVNELQNRGILKTISSKIVGVFKKKRDELPDATDIPNTLYQNATEKMGIKTYGEENKYDVSEYINDTKQLETIEEIEQ